MAVFYRGDSRSPEEIKDGFTLHNQAKATIAQAGGVQEWLKTNVFYENAKDVDLRQFFIATKDRSRPTISTATDEQCGGYSHGGYIYKIQLTHQDYVPVPYEKIREQFHGKSVGNRKPIKWDLYINIGSSFETAEIIGLKIAFRTDEVVFFTDIPRKFITHYKRSGEKEFKAMP